MAITKQQKATQLADLTDKMKKAESVIFSQYSGLTVTEIGEMRQKVREANAEMKVAKKTLMRLAAKAAGLPDVSREAMEGPIACIFSFTDPLSGAQAAFKFAKDHNKVKLIGGIYDGKALTREQAMEMARMPGREQLLAMFASMLISPLTSFASVCSSPLTGMARGLSELAKKKESTPSAS